MTSVLSGTIGSSDKKAFFITPYGKNQSWTRYRAKALQIYLERRFAPLGISVIRADREPQIDSISEIPKQIEQMISSCDICIADISEHNSNVGYEIRIAKENNKAIFYVRDILTEIPAPVDIGGTSIHFFTYEYHPDGELFSQRIVFGDDERILFKSVADTLGVDEPVFDAFAASESDENQLNVCHRQFLSLMDEISSLRLMPDSSIEMLYLEFKTHLLLGSDFDINSVRIDEAIYKSKLLGSFEKMETSNISS